MKVLSNPRRLKASGPIYLYGASEGGRIVKRALDAAGRVTVTAFVDRAPKAEVDGLPVLSAASFLATGDRGATVVIASQHWEDIAMHLSAAGFYKLWTADPIIQRHLAMVRDPASADLERRRRRLKAAGLAAVAALLTLMALIFGMVAGA